MTRALIVVDVQNDFTEGGALAVTGGAAVAARISRYLERHADAYDVIVASRDWHHGDDDNGGHFAGTDAPDFVTTWPVHCVADTAGAAYHPDLETGSIDVHVLKGQGEPAYSAFEGRTAEGRELTDVLFDRSVHAIDVVGLATDHCVRATALDGVRAGLDVFVFEDLVAGVDTDASSAALEEIRAAGGHSGPSDVERGRGRPDGAVI